MERGELPTSSVGRRDSCCPRMAAGRRGVVWIGGRWRSLAGLAISQAVVGRGGGLISVGRRFKV